MVHAVNWLPAVVADQLLSLPFGKTAEFADKRDAFSLQHLDGFRLVRTGHFGNLSARPRAFRRPIRQNSDDSLNVSELWRVELHRWTPSGGGPFRFGDYIADGTIPEVSQDPSKVAAPQKKHARTRRSECVRGIVLLATDALSGGLVSAVGRI